MKLLRKILAVIILLMILSGNVGAGAYGVQKTYVYTDIASGAVQVDTSPSSSTAYFEYMTPTAVYTGPAGVSIRSFSKQYNDLDKLKSVYDELMKNTIGEEIAYLSKIDLIGGYPRGTGTAGCWYGQWSGSRLNKGRYIEIYGCDTIDFTELARVLSHEYGHHFTYYYLNKKEGVGPSDIINSGFSRLRKLESYPETGNGHHMWDPAEIAADDYVQLFGSPTGKKSTFFKDIRDNAISENPDLITSYSSLIYNLDPQENVHIPLAWQVSGLYKYWRDISGVTVPYKKPPMAPLLTLTGINSGAVTLGWTQSIDDTTDDMEYTVLFSDARYQDYLVPIRTTNDSTGRDAVIGTYTSQGGMTLSDDILNSNPIIRVYAKDEDGNVVSSNELTIDPDSLEKSLTKLPARIAGIDRYSTSVSLSKAGWPGTSDYAVLVTGENFPDALSAAPLARKYNAPILLTGSDKLNPDADHEIDRLQVKNVIIVGGNSAVSYSIEDYLKGKNINCIRISGDNRYKTAVEVAKYMGDFSSIVLATGDNYPDALSIASYAASKGIPILLTGKDSMPKDVKELIAGKDNLTSYVIGGTSVIGDSALKDVPNVKRVYGKDRYATNLAVTNEFKDIFNYSSVYLATGEDYPDALSSSALASLTDSPIYLIDNRNPFPVRDAIRLRYDMVDKILAVGGDGVVYNNSLLDIIGNN